MARTKLNLDVQALARIFTFGNSSSGGEATVTIEKGAQSTSAEVLDVKASATIDGNLTVGGNLNVTGNINQQDVTNLQVEDKTITLNKGGASGSSGGSGVEVEAGGAIVAAIRWVSSKWTIGDGTTQRDIADVSSSQTLSNKTLDSPTMTGTPTAPTAAAGTNNNQVATTAYVQNELAELGVASGYFRATAVSGTQDGSNKTFTIANAVSTGSEQILYNGMVLTPGSSNDYVLSGTTLTFQAAFDAPAATDVIRAYGVY